MNSKLACMEILSMQETAAHDDLNDLIEVLNYREGVSFYEKQVSGFVGIVDIVDSTKITSQIIPSKLSKYYSIFLNSMSSIIKEYGGVTVKNMGDCVLFYFSDEGYSEKNCKTVIECGMKMIRYSNILNEMFRKEGLPSIKYRISCDYGNILLAKTVTGTDIFGPTVNYCSKINRLASPDKMIIGNDLYCLAKKLDGYSFSSNSSFSNGLKQDYSAHIVSRR